MGCAVKVHEGQVVTIQGLDYKVVDCEWDNEIALEIVNPEESNGEPYGWGGDCIICSIEGLKPFLS